MQAKGVGLETADFDSLSTVLAGLGAAVVVVISAIVISLVGLDAGAGVKRRRRAGAVGVFPFGLREQAVGLAGLFAQPLHILLRILPTDVDDRPLAPPPALVLRFVAAAASGDAGIPFGEGDFVFADGQRVSNADLVLRAFYLAVLRLAFRRTHHK